MKRILIDMTHITPDKLYASLSIYIFRILDAIPVTERKNFVLLVPSELEDFTQQRYPDYSYILFPASRKYVSNNKLIRITRQIQVYKKIVNSSNCDILFIANDLYPYTYIKTNLKKIVVIHDLKVIKENPRSLVEKITRFANFHFYRNFMKHAEIIVAISNYTKQDILKLYPTIQPSKIKVIYNSVLLAKDSTSPFRTSVPPNYILYVNTLQPHKNIITLLKAFNLIKEKIDHQIVIVGKETPYWKEKVVPYIQENQLEQRIIHLQNLSEEDLKYLYEHAQLFISPSLREGFGYTPIETAICKCPVICSTCEALPDTTQNKLIYYHPPQDTKALGDAIMHTLQNPPSARQLNQISADYTNAYSCSKQVQDFMFLFQNC